MSEVKSDVISFQRIINVFDCDGMLILDGVCRVYEGKNCCIRRVSLGLTVVDRRRCRSLSLTLDPYEIQELLKSLLEFAGEVKLGETLK